MKSGVMEEVRRLFKPEFLNRIDEIMVFHTLNKEEIRKIVLPASENHWKNVVRNRWIFI